MRPIRLLSTVLLSSCLLGSVMTTGCAPVAGPTDTKPKDEQPGDEITYEFETPAFSGFTPNHLALGDTVTVRGAGFIDPEHGKLEMYMKGSFTSQAGKRSTYEGFVPLKYVAPGKATFEFGPDVFFSSTGQDVGTFHGIFQVVSTLQTASINEEAGTQAISEGQTTDIVVEPSIYIDQLRSVDNHNCQPVTRGTTGGQNLALGMKLLGAKDATTNDPITYNITYDSSSALVAYVGNQQYGSWPFWGPTQPKANAAVADGQTTFAVQVKSGTSLTLDPQRDDNIVVNVNPAVMLGQTRANTVKLAGLATLPVTKPGMTMMTLYVRASRADGTEITRTINMPVWNAVELPSRGPSPVVEEYYEPELADVGVVYGSVPNGTDQQYHQGSSETKTHSINMAWNLSNSQMLGLSVGTQFGVDVGIPFVLEGSASVNINASTSQTWSQTFGVDVSESVSAQLDQSTSISQHIVPGMYGALYLQWARYGSRVPVTYHSACGLSGTVGDAVLTYWKRDFYPETSTRNPPEPKHAKPAGPVDATN